MSRIHAIAALTILTMLSSISAQARVCRVSMAGSESGDGSDWAGQAMDLHSALADTGCNEIWVAGGVYKPGEAGDVEASFVINRTLRLYGGFDLSATRLAQRDASTNLTVLSGDIDDNDTVNADGITETAGAIVGNNSHHVVWVDGTTDSGPIYGDTILEGFVISAGDARGTGWNEDMGGGLFCNGRGEGNACSPTLNTMIFVGSRANGGAALCNDGEDGGNSSPTLNNVIIRNNHGLYASGAMHNNGNSGFSSPVLNKVIFIGNSALVGGGAMFNGAQIGISSPILSDVTFVDNTAGYYGGAMVSYSGYGTSSPTLSNVTFIGNSAGYYGGAMHISSESGTTSPVLRNVTFSGNHAGAQGGAILNMAWSNGISEPALRNVISWGNSAPDNPEIANQGAMEVQHSIIQGGCPAGSLCSNVIDADPLLGPLADNGGFTPTMLPGAGGAAIDAGTPPGGCHGTDQRGVSRPQGGSCDIGAVEARVFALTVAVEGQGSVEATSTPVSGAISECDLTGQACTADYTEGTAVELLIAPDSFWHVDAVEGCGGKLTGTSFIVPSVVIDCTVSVTFAVDRYTLEYTAGPNGTLVGQTSQVVDHGADGSLVAAVADSGYHFTQWSDGHPDALRTDTDITADLSVSAEFARNPIDGQCGSAHGGVFTHPPTSDLCAFGEPTALLGDGPWTWTCQGIAGGQDASCSAGYQPPEDRLFGDRFEQQGRTVSAW